MLNLFQRKHQKMVKNCYENNELNTEKLSLLIHHIYLKPRRLKKISKYLNHCIKKEFKQNQTVDISYSIYNEILFHFANKSEVFEVYLIKSFIIVVTKVLNCRNKKVVVMKTFSESKNESKINLLHLITKDLKETFLLSEINFLEVNTDIFMNFQSFFEVVKKLYRHGIKTFEGTNKSKVLLKLICKSFESEVYHLSSGSSSSTSVSDINLQEPLEESTKNFMLLLQYNIFSLKELFYMNYDDTVKSVVKALMIAKNNFSLNLFYYLFKHHVKVFNAKCFIYNFLYYNTLTNYVNSIEFLFVLMNENFIWFTIIQVNNIIMEMKTHLTILLTYELNQIKNGDFKSNVEKYNNVDGMQTLDKIDVSKFIESGAFMKPNLNNELISFIEIIKKNNSYFYSENKLKIFNLSIFNSNGTFQDNQNNPIFKLISYSLTPIVGNQIAEHNIIELSLSFYTLLTELSKLSGNRIPSIFLLYIKLFIYFSGLPNEIFYLFIKKSFFSKIKKSNIFKNQILNLIISHVSSFDIPLDRKLILLVMKMIENEDCASSAFLILYYLFTKPNHYEKQKIVEVVFRKLRLLFFQNENWICFCIIMNIIKSGMVNNLIDETLWIVRNYEKGKETLKCFLNNSKEKYKVVEYKSEAEDQKIYNEFFGKLYRNFSRSLKTTINIEGQEDRRSSKVDKFDFFRR